MAGPYEEGAEMTLRCVVTGGKIVPLLHVYCCQNQLNALESIKKIHFTDNDIRKPYFQLARFIIKHWIYFITQYVRIRKSQIYVFLKAQLFYACFKKNLSRQFVLSNSYFVHLLDFQKLLSQKAVQTQKVQVLFILVLCI